MNNVKQILRIIYAHVWIIHIFDKSLLLQLQLILNNDYFSKFHTFIKADNYYRFIG